MWFNVYKIKEPGVASERDIAKQRYHSKIGEILIPNISPKVADLITSQIPEEKTRDTTPREIKNYFKKQNLDLMRTISDMVLYEKLSDETLNVLKKKTEKIINQYPFTGLKHMDFKALFKLFENE